MVPKGKTLYIFIPPTQQIGFTVGTSRMNMNEKGSKKLKRKKRDTKEKWENRKVKNRVQTIFSTATISVQTLVFYKKKKLIKEIMKHTCE